MGIEVKINGETVIADSTIEDTDIADAQLGLKIRTWFIKIMRDYPSVTSISCEST